MRWLLLLSAAACLGGCKDKPAPPAASGSGSASGASEGGEAGTSGSDAAVPVGSAAGGSDAAADAVASIGGSAADTGSAGSGTVAIETASDVVEPERPERGSAVAIETGPAPAGSGLDYTGSRTDIELRIAFANHVPRLPAVSADGVWVADFGSDVAKPMRPSPIYVRVAQLDGKGKAQRIEIVDLQMAEANADAGDWETNSPPPAVVKVLHERAAAVTKRLHGFVSLSSIETRGSTTHSAKIGAVKFASTENTKKGVLLLVLTDARGKSIQREQIQTYSDGTHPGALEGGTCEFKPRFGGAYLDPAKQRLYIAVAFRWREECTAQEPRYVVWELPQP